MFISKCGNPDCQNLFNYRQGTFFRFPKAYGVGEKPLNTHGVQHFWLCEKCSKEYKLIYREGHGVLLRTNSNSTPPGCMEARFVAAA